jgi:ATP-dependent Clp protease ATP-binding subunit ClpA
VRRAAKPTASSTKKSIAEVVSKMTGIPLTRLSTEDSLRLMKMEDELHKRVVSQEQAVSAVAKRFVEAAAD